MLSGSFDAVAILTYNADLAFDESVLLRQLVTCRTQVLLADPLHLAQAIGPASLRGQLRRLNRTYVAAPIAGVPSAHAKMILLLSPTEGRLLVGSGNLSHAGYAGLGEVFTAYAWTPERPDDLPAFVTARDVLNGLAQRSMLEPSVRARVAALWHNAPWLVGAAGTVPGSSPVRHNLEVPLGAQFGAELEGDKVNSLVVLAPFHLRGVAGYPPGEGSGALETRRRHTGEALAWLMGPDTVVRHRPDGKPEVDGMAQVSASHGAGLTFAVAADLPVGCDVEIAVVERERGVGRPARRATASRSPGCSPPTAARASRSRAPGCGARRVPAQDRARRCRRAGPGLAGRSAGSWLRSGAARIAGSPRALRGLAEPVVFTMLVEGGE